MGRYHALTLLTILRTLYLGLPSTHPIIILLTLHTKADIYTLMQVLFGGGNGAFMLLHFQQSHLTNIQGSTKYRRLCSSGGGALRSYISYNLTCLIYRLYGIQTLYSYSNERPLTLTLIQCYLPYIRGCMTCRHLRGYWGRAKLLLDILQIYVLYMRGA